MPSDVKLIMHSLKCDITTGTVGERGKQLNYFFPSKFNFFFTFYFIIHFTGESISFSNSFTLLCMLRFFLKGEQHSAFIFIKIFWQLYRTEL